MKSKMVFIPIESGRIVKAETLSDAIEQHPEIEQVVLFWTWRREYYTSNAGPFEGYVCENCLDQEYSFQGDREKALMFANAYDCWDGSDFVILDGRILYGYEEQMNYQTDWNDGYDHISGISDGIDPSWISAIRVDCDYSKGIEYLIEPQAIPKEMME